MQSGVALLESSPKGLTRFEFSADLFAQIRLQLAFQRSRIHHLRDCPEILVRNSLKSTESRCHFVHVGRDILIDDNMYRMFVTCFPLFNSFSPCPWCSHQAANPSQQGDEYSNGDTITIDLNMDTNEVGIHA